jgi:EmrB/QacA subfamily drug resistance transporter
LTSPETAAITPEQRLSLVGIFVSIFLAALDQTIVATALPRIVEDLHGTELYAWVATAYLLASTVALPVFGRLSEIYARKWVLLTAVAVFLAGSALAGLSPSMDALIAFRALQGVGSGGIFAVALTVLGVLFPPRQRGRLQGLFGAVFGLANVLGPYLGGLITDHLTWRWIFYVNVPTGALAVFFLVRHMPHLTPEARHRFDLTGAFGLALWTVPLLLAVSWGGSTYPWGSPEIVGLLALAAAGLAFFLVAERRNPEPLFDLSLFRLPTFRWAMVGTFLHGAAFLGAILFLPLYLVQVQGISATNSGLSLTPLTLGIVVGSFTSGQLASRLGRVKPILAVGLAWLAMALFAVHTLIALHTPLWQIVVAMVATGIGIGPGMPLYTLAVQNDVPFERIGVASSASQFFRQVGSTVGAALLGTVLITTLNTAVPKALPPALRAAAAHFHASQEENPVAIGPAVRAHMAATYREIARALAGDRRAYDALLADPAVPAAEKRLLPKGGLPAAVARADRRTVALVSAALAGDVAARRAVLADPNLPAAIKGAVAHPPADPSARQAVVRALAARLDARQPHVVAATMARVLAAVRKTLRHDATLIVQDLRHGLAVGITEAERRIFLYAGILALLAFLAALLLPDRELRRQHARAPSAEP